MSILSLDLGGTMGWAIMDYEYRIDSGIKKFKEKDKGKRYFIFYETLDSFIEDAVLEHAIDHIVYEKVRRHIGADAAHAYGFYEGSMLAMANRYDLKVVGLEVKSVKKMFTGNGNANKQLMINKVIEKYEYTPIDDNEADAIAIGTVFYSNTL